MAIEYILDVIKASAGQDITVSAQITDADNKSYTDGCHLMLFDKDRKTLIMIIDGDYLEELDTWSFTIPAEATRDRDGRYWYCICHESISLCFKQPIYIS